MDNRYSPPALTPEQRKRHAAGAWTFLVPYQKALLRTDEVAHLLGGVATNIVRRLIELGELEAHTVSAFGERGTYRITRRSVELYLIAHSNYDPHDFEERLGAIARTLTPAALDKLIVVARRRREELL